jgi:hypothetical protein
VEIVSLVGGDRRSLEDGESCGRKQLGAPGAQPSTRPPCSCSRRRSAPREAVALVVRTHAVKTVATCQPSLEVINVREFDIRHRALLVIAVLVEPWNRVRTRAAVGRFVIFTRNFNRTPARQDRSNAISERHQRRNLC